MARSTQEIFDASVAEGIRLANDANLPDVAAMFANTSRVAVWKILFWAVAFIIHSLEVIYDLFRAEIDDRVLQLKAHSARWYAEKAKLFQYGYNLIPETDGYDNSGLSEDQIAASKIVAYAAVVEQERGIRIKIAKIIGGDLGPLAADELTAFEEYMEQIKDAGIKLLITSGVADDLKTTLRIFYNPLVLNSAGGRIDGIDPRPVQAAFQRYLKNLPFNGIFAPMLMVDQLQSVDGVVLVQDDLWQARYGALDFNGIDVEYNPDSGYLRIADVDLDASLTFIPHSVI